MGSKSIIRSLKEEDWKEILQIFNYFITESFAVYSSIPVSEEHLILIEKQIRIGLVIENENKVIGFGWISYYRTFPNFNRTGVLTYFILPEYTGKGWGTKILDELICKGKEAGITNFLAHISSKNEQSIRFHQKHGFEIVGRFKNVADKFNEPFDIIWVQKDTGKEK